MKKDRPVSKGVKPKGDSVTTQQEPVEWSVEGFIDEFFKINSQMLDRSFLFILGSGASISSGIPGAAALADRWLKELYDLEGGSGQPIEVWAAGILHSTDFQMENIAEFYPVIFESRFRNDPERGYADLENVMSQARPNVGYSVLAQILAKTRHKVLLTTNFDNLVEQSLFQYSDTFPLVCGHESLAGFARPKLRRPLVAKIHRDLLLEPQNAPAQISQLDPKWRTVLGKLLKEYCPLVIGYGGNDGSLMGFLENLLPGEIQTRLSWCYHRGSQPSKRIKDLVSKHDGRLIPILGFDEFMIQLNQKFYWPMLIEDMEAKSKSRVETYRLNFEKFSKMVEAVEGGDRQKSMEPVKRAVRDTVDRDQSWFSWFLKARRETDPKKAEQIYKDGIDKNPRSAQLFGSFAVFMYEIRKEYDEAEVLYKKALELDPGDVRNMGNYANFMYKIRKEYDEAE
ncbi:MAG: hypothetical protein Q8P44_08235, partial [Dehalococcoidia bacterium]|nr:hypothetical protein [Dehalococcoidia bacterium]